MYVNEDVRWGWVAACFFAASATTPMLRRGRGEAAIVVFDGKRCAKAHAMVVFTYRVAGKVYVNGVVEWVLSLRGFFAAPTPALPHGGGRRAGEVCSVVVVFAP